MQSNSGAREVWFIRHGESVANAGGITTEIGACLLTDLGHRQAEQIAQGLLRAPDLIVHSGYVRARQTAEPTMRRFAGSRAEEWTVQELQYLDPAKCIGTTQDERRLLAQDYWQLMDPLNAPPGAESFVVFIQRAADTLERLARRSERLTYVFSHGHFMRCVLWYALMRPAVLDLSAMRSFHHFIHATPIGNGTVMPLFFHPTGEISAGPLTKLSGVEVESPVARSLSLNGL